jgi:hypothetical protein
VNRTVSWLIVLTQYFTVAIVVVLKLERFYDFNGLIGHILTFMALTGLP